MKTSFHFILVVGVNFAVGCGSSSISPAIVPTPTAVSSYSRMQSVDYGSGSLLEPFTTPTPNIFPATTPSITQANLSLEFVGDGLCQCDLLVGECDIWCCCDRDCSVSSLMIFNCSSMSSSEVCINFEASEVFRSALGLCSCPDSSLLCVAYVQDPSRLDYGNEIRADSLEDFSSLEITHALPGDAPLVMLEQANHAALYLIGDPILVLKNLSISHFEFFTLPVSFYNHECHDGNPITYLSNQKNTCHRSLKNLVDDCTTLSSLAYFENHNILKTPSSINAEDLVSIEIASVLCRTFLNLTYQPCRIGPSTLSQNGSICEGAVEQVHYTILHDGGGTILNCSVDLVLGSVTEGILDQQFSVVFIENSESRRLKRSGNPGYVYGAIILAGSLTEFNEINISTDRSLWLHVKDSSRSCQNRANLPVKFMEELHATCLLNVSESEIMNDCSGVRSRAYATYDTDNRLDFVGRYGNSDPLNVSQWTRILNQTLNLHQKSSGYICDNIPTNLEISILFTNTGQVNNPQSVLAGVRYNYFAQDINFEFIRGGHLSIQTTVKFIDISTEPEEVLPSIEGTIMTLPQDFFYPLFISNSAFIVLNYKIVSLCFIQLFSILLS